MANFGTAKRQTLKGFVDGFCWGFTKGATKGVYKKDGGSLGCCGIVGGVTSSRVCVCVCVGRGCGGSVPVLFMSKIVNYVNWPRPTELVIVGVL